MSKAIILSDGAYEFLRTHLPSDGTDAHLVESELSNHSLAMLDEVVTALTGAEAPEFGTDPEHPELPDGDYVLKDEAAWFTVGPFSVRVRLHEGELKMSAYKAGDEDNERGPYAEAVAFAEDIQDDDPAVQAAATLSPEALADAAREGQELGTCDED